MSPVTHCNDYRGPYWGIFEQMNPGASNGRALGGHGGPLTCFLITSRLNAVSVEGSGILAILCPGNNEEEKQGSKEVRTGDQHHSLR